MAASGMAGPLIVYGQNPAQAGTNYQPDYNGDNGPSAFAGGTMLLDPRYGYRAPLQTGSLAAVGFANSAEYLLIDQAPATLSTTALSTAQASTAGVPLTLISASAGAITVSTAALTIAQSGVVLPVGTRFIDSAPALIYYGQSSAIASIDPRTMLSRVLSVTSNAAATGTTITLRGFDVFGFPLTEVITQVAGTTVAGKKGFKSLTSATPATTDAGHTYSIGTTDVFEFPLMVSIFNFAEMAWNNADIIANTGFVAADTTTATGTTGSVRGTYAVQSASDGTKRLQVSVLVPPQNAGTANGVASLFGQTQFAG